MQSFVADVRHKPPTVSSKTEFNFLLLSTSLLIDRVYRFTNLVPRLALCGEVTLWASSFEGRTNEDSWDEAVADVQTFPSVLPFREFPYNFFRRLNEYVWDYRYKLPSRISMRKHRRDKRSHLLIRALKPPARILASMRSERWLESRLEKSLLSFPRSPEAEVRLRELKPSVVVSTGPFQFEQPAIYSAARKLGIPTIAYIPSWDNVSTKNRMVFDYDGYLVWNEQSKEELHAFYPRTKQRPVYVVGPPQFDVFAQSRFHVSRRAFCASQGLDPSLPIIVYAVGSPNFLKEWYGAEHLASAIAQGRMGDVQLLIRPHPIHDNAEMQERFSAFAPRVRLQKTRNAGRDLTKRTQDRSEIVEWINTFRHADVVVNLSSTVTVDAAIVDRPVVNLNFDPQPGQADQELIKEVNHKWNHFKPIAESGGVWLVNDFEELKYAVRTYIRNPSLHRAKRKWIAQYVCGYLDGRCGERFSDAVVEFCRSLKTRK